jgi:hypothetical protein
MDLNRLLGLSYPVSFSDKAIMGAKAVSQANGNIFGENVQQEPTPRTAR